MFSKAISQTCAAILIYGAAQVFSISFAQNTTMDIRLNQVGFYPAAPKIAVVAGDQHSDFAVKQAGSGKVVFKGKLSAARKSEYSGKMSKIADLTPVSQPGKYVVEVAGMGTSPVFEIKNKVHREVTEASLKGFYYQRASTALPEKYAGKWARPAGHPDNKIFIHASAISENRPENFVISSARGWYDAGDYNKYIVNSGVTMGTLLSLYEDYPLYFENFNINIPESNNSIPDLLDEVIWNLRWMLTMQDPADGGVYHKLTNPRFDGTIMPEACDKPRYVVQKSTPAALDFVAVMAQAGRILKGFENKLPGLSDSCLVAAVKGWDWAKKHPDTYYNQDEMNKKFDPDVVTGAYGDKSAADEWIWAAAEMYVATNKPEYLKGIDLRLNQPMPLLTWSNVQALGYYTLLRFSETMKMESAVSGPVKKAVKDYADKLLVNLDKQPYHTVMGSNARDYSWGGSSVAANQGIALLYTLKMTGDKKYLHAALGNLDYLMGRNATTFCFLTGFGTKRVMHPHHRPSMADGIADPVPGLLSGGPNPGQQDKCKTYTSNFADESFTDDDCSYASNEIAINWNAPMVYLSAAIEALMER